MSDSALIQQMMNLQDQFNSNLSTSWRQDGNAYHRATWLEAAELIESLNWKWWKHQTNDWGNVTVELVDIWHFVMSQAIIRDYPSEMIELTMDTHLKSERLKIREAKDQRIILLVEELAKSALEKDLVKQISLFFKVWGLLGHSLQDLFKLYVGKNALNHFRQSKGYKQGTYIKIWNGQEDNVYMLKIMEEIDLSTENVFQQVIDELDKAYPAE